jgi:hypothetical protein
LFISASTSPYLALGARHCDKRKGGEDWDDLPRDRSLERFALYQHQIGIGQTNGLLDGDLTPTSQLISAAETPDPKEIQTAEH